MTQPNSIDANQLRKSFPIFEKRSLIYLDSAATSQKPKIVIDAVKNFYNDSFIMDQNACSSPHLILWDKNAKIQDKKVFWNTLEKYVVKNFHINSIKVKKRCIIINF